MEQGPRCCSRAPRPFAFGLHLAVGRLRVLFNERVALDVRPQSLGSINTKPELEVHHLLEIDRGSMSSQEQCST